MKILSVNMCCMPNGFFHKIIFYQFLFSNILFNIFLNILSHFQYIFIPINFLINIILCWYITVFFGKILRLFGYNDYQKERIHELSNLFEKYDFIVLQEIFSLYLYDNSNIETIIELGKKYGHVYSCIAENNTYSSLSNGLLILSKHEIESVNTHNYKSHNIFEKTMIFMPLRGVLNANIKLKNEKILSIFTCHNSPDPDIIGYIPNLIVNWWGKIRDDQYIELSNFVNKYKSELCIVLGDFNAHLELDNKKGYKNSEKEIKFIKNTDLKQCKPLKRTFGYNDDNLLSNEYQKKKNNCLDLAFLSKNIEYSMKTIKMKSNNKKYKYLSDHRGLEISFEIN